ncbi:MAG: hypothetical protein ACI82O_003824, partial [Patiriisocius sp.]
SSKRGNIGLNEGVLYRYELGAGSLKPPSH